MIGLYCRAVHRSADWDVGPFGQDLGEKALMARIKVLVQNADTMLVPELPFIGLALLSYMIVLWFLAARTRDRWGFGMALGIGVLLYRRTAPVPA